MLFNRVGDDRSHRPLPQTVRTDFPYTAFLTVSRHGKACTDEPGFALQIDKTPPLQCGIQAFSVHKRIAPPLALPAWLYSPVSISEWRVFPASRVQLRIPSLPSSVVESSDSSGSPFLDVNVDRSTAPLLREHYTPFYATMGHSDFRFRQV